MEKYSQFRDRGSGVAPFFPIKPKLTGIYLPINIFFFIVKLPFIAVAVAYFLLLQWLPLGSLYKKSLLWTILVTQGLWWIDLQIDGVRKGSLAKKHLGRVPGPSDIIASSFASPIDALYLAAIFDPIFIVSYPYTEQVQVVSLLSAIFRALAKPEEYPPKNAKMTEIKTLIACNQQRAIAVFPECTTTNGFGIMPLSPCLLGVSTKTKIFPLHIRYTPSDITTPMPGLFFSFLWNLLATSTHSIRVRIAHPVYNIPSSKALSKEQATTKISDMLYKRTNNLDSSELMSESKKSLPKREPSDEKNVLEHVGEALARLGRIPRVGLTIKDKIAFIEASKSERQKRS